MCSSCSGDILGQEVLYCKICTCPKRDRNQDERNLQSNKRKLSGASDDEEIESERGRKLRRSAHRHDIKEEIESNDSSDLHSVPADWQVSRSVDGNYQLVIKCGKKDLLLDSIEGMIEKTAVALLRNPQNSKLVQHANHLINLKSKLVHIYKLVKRLVNFTLF